jgi:hypothetical protein
MMKIIGVALTGLAVFLSSPFVVSGQTTQPTQNQPMPPGTNGIGVIEGTVMKVDTQCAGASSGAADCQAVVEVAPLSAQGTGGATGTSTTYSSPNTQETLKITIPKSLRIQTDQLGENSASTPHPSQLQIARGQRVKINYEKKPDGGNVATAIAILKLAS